jgi:hypothetical protein
MFSVKFKDHTLFFLKKKINKKKLNKILNNAYDYNEKFIFYFLNKILIVILIYFFLGFFFLEKLCKIK